MNHRLISSFVLNLMTKSEENVYMLQQFNTSACTIYYTEKIRETYKTKAIGVTSSFLIFFQIQLVYPHNTHFSAGSSSNYVVNKLVFAMFLFQITKINATTQSAAHNIYRPISMYIRWVINNDVYNQCAPNHTTIICTRSVTNSDMVNLGE